MQTIRSFMAIELPNSAKLALTRLRDRFNQLIPPNTVRWTNSASIHLTLHFLGDVPTPDLDKIIGAMGQSATTVAPFSLKLEGCGCFPNFYRPRIVWVGVTGKVDPLVKLYQDLGERLKTIGFPPETRPYSPHLTIGRVKDGLTPELLNQLGQQIEQTEVSQITPLAVKAISLMQSSLHPTGAVYTQLAEIAIG